VTGWRLCCSSSAAIKIAGVGVAPTARKRMKLGGPWASLRQNNGGGPRFCAALSRASTARFH